MARDLDQFPLYDPLIKVNEQGATTTSMSEVWQSFMAAFLESLQEYLSANGMFVPRLNSAQVLAIQTPIQGQLIYNTTLDAPQIYQAGTWKTFTTT